ncbi:hypothetical protein VNI00_013918 [Paramarasmius palmivorus]|uniref:Glycoside hydrolase family 76 protein n=1 Tax=Paramarasmius palmivorus TaxID=297713 RepID=A0AAW0BUR1_9AGAR
MVMIWIFLYAINLVDAQPSTNFAPNPNWRKPEIHTSQEERIAIAKAGIDKALSLFVVDGQTQIAASAPWKNYGAAGRLYALMAQFDSWTNQTIYKEQLLKYFAQSEELYSGFRRGYGIAAAKAYTIYSDPAFLAYAQTSWTTGKSFTLSEKDLRAGVIPFKNVSIKETCAQLPMAGGTFWITLSSDPYVNSLATASYLLMTALLLEITNDTMYLDSAIETETFYYNHLQNTRGTLLDGIHADGCTISDRSHPANEGLMIEGLAILSSFTKNETINQHFFTVLEGTLFNPDWHTFDGIINADTKTISAERVGQYIVRGLTAFCHRNSTPSEIRTYVRGYLGVQYNAVVDYARDQGSDIYGPSWIGPPSSSFSLDNQTNALTALVASIPDMQEMSSGTGGSHPDPPSGSPSASSGQSSNAGAIIGSVVGSLVFLAFVIVLSLYVIRRKTRNQVSHTDLGPVAVPYSITEKTPGMNEIRRQKFEQLHPAVIFQQSSESSRASSVPETVTETSAYMSSETDTLGNLPTATLVRLVNARLQPGHWREDEVLPEYATERSEGSRRRL